MTWHVEHPGRFYDAGEDTVVYYDPYSGDTHLLSAFGAHLLRQLITTPSSTETLLAAVAAETESGEAAEVAEAVSGMLQDLLRLDIIRQD